MGKECKIINECWTQQRYISNEICAQSTLNDMQYSYAPISVACEYGVECVGTIETTRNEQCNFF